MIGYTDISVQNIVYMTMEVEFTGIPFMQILVLNGIKNGTITVKNPQTNAISEHLHQSTSNSPWIMLKAHPPIKEFQAQNIVDTLFAAS